MKRLSRSRATSKVKRFKKSETQKTEKLHNTASKMAIPKAKRFTVSEGLRNTCAANQGKAAQHAHRNVTLQPSLEFPKLLQNSSTRGGPSYLIRPSTAIFFARVAFAACSILLAAAHARATAAAAQVLILLVTCSAREALHFFCFSGFKISRH